MIVKGILVYVDLDFQAGMIVKGILHCSLCIL